MSQSIHYQVMAKFREYRLNDIGKDASNEEVNKTITDYDGLTIKSIRSILLIYLLINMHCT